MRPLRLVLAAVLVGVLPGCSDDDAGPGLGEYVAPPALEGAEPVAADADLEDCGLEPGEQTVAGEVVNASSGVADFVITLTWSNDDLENLGAGFVVLEDVEAGETSSFEVTATVRDGAAFCVPNVQRGTLPD